MSTLLQDLQYGCRMLAKSPGFTAVAVITLALGIGANTAIFSVVDAVVLRTLPVTRPEQLVRVRLLFADGRDADGFPLPLFQELRRENNAVAGLIGFDGALFNTTIDGSPEMIRGHFVSGNFYSVLGVSAALGRTLTDDDEHLSDRPPAAVISYDYWKERFALNPAVVGKTIYVNRIPFTIVGVTPKDFFGVPPEKSSVISIPMAMHSRLALKDHTTVGAVARLLPTIPGFAAQAHLTALVQQIASAHTPLGAPSAVQRELLTQRVNFIPAGRGGWREFSLGLQILMTVVIILLVIACVNLANLLLARAATRSYEIATRLAVGASRPRIVRQLLTESLLLAIGGGALGFLVSLWTVDLLPRLLSYDDVPVSVDFRLLFFTIAISIGAGVLFGIAPALRGTKVDLISALKRGNGTGGFQRGRLGRTLVVVQVSLSFALLISAGLFVTTLVKLNSVDPGFSRERVLLASMFPTLLGYGGERELALYDSVLQQVRTIPGLEAASISRFPMFRGYWGRNVALPNGGGGLQDGLEVSCNVIAPEFFRTMGIPFLLGRDFTAGDTASSPKAAIVNESFARRFFAGLDPIGQSFTFKGQDGLVTVVGVVKDLRSGSLRGDDDRSPLATYIPLPQASQWILGQATLEVRAVGDPSSLIEAVRRRVRKVDQDLSFKDVESQAALVDESLSGERTLATLTSGFSVLALALAGIGLFGVTAYSVAQRTKEIGVRMALGAQRTNILGLVLHEAMIPVVVGLGIGATGAVVAARLIATQLFGVAPTDPVTIGAALLLMIAVAGVATIVPARRATKVHPMVALRYE